MDASTSANDERHPVEILAEDFVSRFRRGEYPNISDFVESNPQHASEINLLFPMIAAMEQLKGKSPTPLTRSPSRSLPLLPKKLGDYRIIREIGRGGMGIVYEAEQQSLSRRVALKVLPEHALADDKRLKRFLVESQTAARLHHSNIVPVFGVGQEGGVHYFVMQFIHGVGLDRIIQHVWDLCNPGEAAEESLENGAERDSESDAERIAAQLAEAMLKGRLCEPAPGNVTPPHAAAADKSTPHVANGAAPNPDPRRFELNQRYWRSVAQIGVQVAEALQYAHAHGTVHRDVKPANLLIDKSGDVWITDFGLAKAASHDDINRTREIGGTVRYMSPEQFRGEYHPRSDVYGLGITLYELAVLIPAFPESDPDKLVLHITQTDPPPPGRSQRALPRDLETIILKATSRELDRRYATAGELADDLRRFLDDKPIRARRISPFERLVRWSRRNPAVASLGTLLLIVAIAAFTTVSWKWREAESENQRAEANLSLALDSMNATMDQFASTWMAHPIGPITEDDPGDTGVRIVVSDESAAILQDALKFYNQFAMQNSGNPRLRLDTARAYRRVGQIRHRLGQLDKAEAAYRTATAIYREVLRESPTDTDVLRRAATVLNDLGGVIQESGRLIDAEKPLVEAREMLLAHSSDYAVFAQSRYELSRTYINLGSLLFQMGSRTDGADNQHRAMELLEQLSTQQPGNPNFRLAQARCYRNLYSSFSMDRNKSADYKANAISILESLIRDYPDVPDYQCELAEILTYINTRTTQDEEFEENRYQLGVAIDICRYLNEKYPAFPRYEAGLARATQRMGSLLVTNRQREEAEVWLHESVEIYRGLMNRFPTIEGYKSFYASASFADGENLRHLGRLQESRAAIESAISHQREVFEVRPPNSFEKGSFARQYSSLAETLKLLGEDESAKEAERVSREIWSPAPRWPTSRTRGPWPNRYTPPSWKKTSKM